MGMSEHPKANPVRLNVPSLATIRDEAEAYRVLEILRWGGRPVCPHCGSVAKHYFLTPKNDEGRLTNRGKVSQRRVWKCKDCRKQFTVLVGTIFHGTKIEIRTWLLVIYELCSSKNGVSSREIERKYGLTPKSAWFLLHRIREAMKREPLAGKFWGEVQADETWIGGSPKNRHRKQRLDPEYNKAHKSTVMALIHRETGEVRSRVIADVKGPTLRAVLDEETHLTFTHLRTDGHSPYTPIGWKAASHETVDHYKHEYARGPVTTNHVEGFFSQLKRSLDGTYHHVSREHLHRYLAEFDYRYSTRKMSDGARMASLIEKRTFGRRLQYRPLAGE